MKMHHGAPGSYRCRGVSLEAKASPAGFQITDFNRKSEIPSGATVRVAIEALAHWPWPEGSVHGTSH